jgi:hypothetical protein
MPGLYDLPRLGNGPAPAGMAPGIIVARCNPFGHTTGPGGDRGPRHLMGGLYSAAYEGEKKWYCPNRVDGRYRMTCQCDPPHRGQEMPLCYSHVAMIGRRMSGICPPCVMPPEARALHQLIQDAQALAAGYAAQGAPREIVRAAVDRADDLGLQMNELVVRGIAHRCRLTLTEVS